MFQKNEHDLEIAYGMYSDMLYRVALSYMNHKEDAEDVVQEVFTKYMTRLHLPMNKEHEKAWFVRVTINQCHDALRRRSYRQYSSLEDVAETVSEETQDSGVLFETLSVLPEKYKGVVVLHYLEGYSVEETAKMLRISISAAKMRLKRGREYLKSELERK